MTLVAEPRLSVDVRAGAADGGISVDQRSGRLGVSLILAAIALLLIGIPSGLVVRQLGGQATPAMLAALLMFVWWLCARLTPRSGISRVSSALRACVGLFFLGEIASYAEGTFLHLSGLQQRGADRGMLYLAGLVGLSLMAMDGIESRRGLDRVLKTVVFMSTLSAALGILSFFTRLYPVDRLSIPGLSSSAPLSFIGTRQGLPRVAGTAQHPLEFGLVLALSLPLALHYARFEPERRDRRRWWLCVAAIAAAVPMALSRAAIMGVAVAAIVMFPTWPRRFRTAFLAGIPVAVGAMHVVKPGLFGTLNHLFSTAASSASIAHRTDNYARVGSLMRHHWILGTGGFGSYDPLRFSHVLDNQYLGQLIESGVVGLFFLLLLFWLAMSQARQARLSCVEDSKRDLAQSLSASVAVAVPALFTFDVFGYPMATGLLFLLIGCCGAVWRLSHREQLAALRIVQGGPAMRGARSAEHLRDMRPS